ncbi:MAG TPA: hypothetical protein VIL20_24675 [Sandaracinaceae bacterium]
MAGYSGTPLPKKLGIREGARVALLRAPEGFDAVLGALPPGVRLQRDLRGSAPIDVALLFATARADLEARFAKARDRIAKNGGLWVCWPKKSAGVPSDLTEDVTRAVGLAAGLVDNKVCAVDETWSGLRFVWRTKDR